MAIGVIIYPKLIVAAVLVVVIVLLVWRRWR
jgi:hypothetical protein